MCASAKTRRDFFKSVGLGTASLFVTGCVGNTPVSAEKSGGKRPNVVLVMTDDQGYGDIACLGNRMIKTPNIDELYSRSVRLTDFHVSPTCSPTRASLMTGRYCNATGVWHTVMGRSLLRRDEVTLGDCFKASGYRTAVFGKWHLGDNYPFRPQERGFDEVLIHGGGAIGNTPDYFGNDYFDDTYFHGDKPEKFTGYCTDVWFDRTMSFIKDCAQNDRPFFCYIPTNAAHGPYRVAEDYKQPYDADPNVPNANFYGMITNIDDNMGRLVRFLKDNHLQDNTLLIFMTDNGSAVGAPRGKGFNAGMRGFKGSEYEGGHRVPCFIYWPGGGLTGPRDIDTLTAHIDILPTLVDICGLKRPAGPKLHGVSLKPLLYGRPGDWKDRAIVVDSQRMENLIKWRQCSVMEGHWRLVNGKELYNINKDPGQEEDIAADHPEVVERLRGEYEKWWQEIAQRGDEYVPTVLGHDAENPTCLTSHDWHDANTGYPVFDQSQVRRAVKSNGFWAVDVARAGRYEVQLRRWPREVDQPIDNSIPGGEAINAVQARLTIGNIEQTTAVNSGDKAAIFSVNLEQGPATLQTWLIDEDGQSRGAYYVYVRRL
ncbi:MAG TPA: arylsulfatase [Sedimentisphaerales bacterium]|nr:arylsulfatase [Sedimentisphaerales bacterium]